MLTYRGPFAWLRRLLARIGPCGNAGLAVGVVTGYVLTLFDLIDGPLQLTSVEALETWLALAIFGWVMLLFLFTAIARWSLRSVIAPALVNAGLVTGLTVIVCWIASLFAIAWLIGLLVGLLVGFLLCSLYRRVARA
jgi:hypothetical protein